MTVLQGGRVPVPGSAKELVLRTARMLLERRLLHPVEYLRPVTSAEIAAELGEPRAAVVELLMRLGREGRLRVHSTRIGLDMEVTDVRVMAADRPDA